MTDKEVHKLKRPELLEILVEQKKEIARLEECLAQAEEKLKNRTIKIDKAGSIAEAALQLNGIFEAADAAVEQYIVNIKETSSRQQEVCKRMEEETRRKCDAMIAEAEQRCAVREREMESCYKELADKLQKFYEGRP